MNILVINCGSSSLKYQLIEMNNEKVLVKGLVERIGADGSVLIQKVEGKEKYIVKHPMKNHKDALQLVLNAIIDKTNGIIKSMEEISAVGHRVVHGGEAYTESVRIDDNVMKSLEECISLAPLHNPPNILGINICKELMPKIPMVAVFDTAFHHTIPREAYLYAIPLEYYTHYGIRKYGFHGTSHKYVSQKASEDMGKDIHSLKIITCHLGNGSSIAAIKNGICIDTTMGFTPLEGVPMGTRSGSIDPSIVSFLEEKLRITGKEVLNILNKEAGVLGISGTSSDFRDLLEKSKEGDIRAKLAIDIFEYKVRTYIGAYAAAMNGVDCIVFTAGVGENSSEIREGICQGLDFIGVELNLEKNKERGIISEISSENSKVKVYVVPTNEEMMIAKETVEVINKQN